VLNALIFPLIPQASGRFYIFKAKHQRLLKQGIWGEVLFLTDSPCSRQGKQYEAILLVLGGFLDSPMVMIIENLGVR
jgi:hypothetical protein